MHPDIRAYDSAIEGRGLTASRPIPKHAVVWRLADAPGRLLTLRELKRLPPEQRHLAYRYKDRHFLSEDASRFMNHSCEPNTVWADDETLIAARDIAAGEEVTFDYATSDVHVWWRAKWRCRCGAPSCRGVVTGRDCLDPSFAARHRGHLPSWTVAFMRHHVGLRGRLSWLLYAGAELVRRLRPGGT
ncbi:SET domain-containing protein [Falsiroseomonas sp. E2-1-a20]|uniref:SET domain-containing protein n=1 Tax=Falsiroseomonas sp. E2-1-a20 TaxID=3239300 RepID=UPI003F3AC937